MKRTRLIIAFLGLISLAPLALAKHQGINWGAGGLTYRPDNYSTFVLSGYAKIEATKFSRNDFGLKNEIFLQSLEYDIFATFGQDLHFDLSGDWMRPLKVKTAYVEYDGWKNIIFQVGQIFPNFGLNNTNSVGQLNYVEFNLPSNTFSTDYYLGSTFLIHNQQLSAFFSVFGPRIAVSYESRYPFGALTREVWSPIHNEHQTFETGISLWYQKPDGSNTSGWGTVPEVDSRDMTSLADTGTILNTRNSLTYDLEIAYQLGSFYVAGEYMSDRVSRLRNNQNLTFSGSYLSTSVFLTGEHHPYQYPEADFLAISKIKHSFGAFELAARLSQLNLNSHDVRGGREKNMTLGFNWYLSQHFKLILNYIDIWFRSGTTHKNQRINTYAAQLEYLT